MTTYTELVQQIRDYTETDSSVLTDSIINDFIEHTENRILKELDLPVFRSYQFSNFTTGKAAYFATGTLDLSSYQQISFWVGQDSGTRSAPASPNLSLHLCTDTQGDVGVHSMSIYTGPDSSSNQGFWRSMKKDFETNLNSSIQSVALYVDTDNGAQNIYLDNIIASKAASAADSITLDSIVGLKTSTDFPNYLMINSTKYCSIVRIKITCYFDNIIVYYPFKIITA